MFCVLTDRLSDFETVIQREKFCANNSPQNSAELAAPECFSIRLYLQII